MQWVRKEIGPIASPDLIQFAPGLPKTRSGKIMRRILRKIAEDDYGALGDTSTLADPAVVDDLVKNRQNRKGGVARCMAAARRRPSRAVRCPRRVDARRIAINDASARCRFASRLLRACHSRRN